MIAIRPQASVQVICDLRLLKSSVTTAEKMRALWQQITYSLVGKKLVQGQAIVVPADGSEVELWVVDAQGLTEVAEDTVFHIVDILRNPSFSQSCRICRAYSPFRCIQCVSRCVKEKRPLDQACLCSSHARVYLIQDRLTAYCQKHIPSCQCSLPSCKEEATFSCISCHKLCGGHFLHVHEYDKNIEYCEKCYRRLFGRCAACLEEGRDHSIGKLGCAFTSQEMTSPCSEPLCWEHAWQWKIWGVHFRGIIFCKQHSSLVRNADPCDVLTMMITSIPPRQGYSLANAYRLRRLLNRERKRWLSFEETARALHDLVDTAATWDQQAQKRYKDIVSAFDNAIQELPNAQAEALGKIKDFYEKQPDGNKIASMISSVSIVDRYRTPGKRDVLLIIVRMKAAGKGHTMKVDDKVENRLNETKKQLEERYHLRVLKFTDGTRPAPRRINAR